MGISNIQSPPSPPENTDALELPIQVKLRPDLSFTCGIVHTGQAGQAPQVCRVPRTACCVKQLSENTLWKSDLSKPFPPQPDVLSKREGRENLKTEPLLRCELLLKGTWLQSPRAADKMCL